MFYLLRWQPSARDSSVLTPYRIEHRLFSFITMNRRGRPLVSHEVIVSLIAGTRTRSGLIVHAEIDPAAYPKGVVVTDAELAAIRLERDDFQGDWNYSI